MSIVRASARRLRKFVIEILKTVGMKNEYAEIIAEHLVLANLRGVDSHGVIRVKVYLDGIEEGLINSNPKLGIISEREACIVMDGDGGLGHIVAYEATLNVIRKAKRFDIAIAGTKNHWHVGMMAYYILKIVENDMVGICMANSSLRVSLPGFTKGIVGTNPLAMGFPAQQFPIIFDAATSIASAGKILMYKKRGEKIPKGWAIDKHGEITTDPNKALKGFLLPIGGYKGFGIALSIDILCGIIMGGGIGLKLPRTLFTQGGLTIIAIDIDAFSQVDEYYKQISSYISTLKQIKGKEGQELIIPGELEARSYQERLKEGIPLPSEVYKELVSISEKYLGINILN